MAEFENNTNTSNTDGFTETTTTGPLGNVENTIQIPNNATILAKPDTGRIALETDPNATYAISFDPNDANLSLENGDLVFNFTDGTQLILGDFAEVSPIPTIMLSDGTILAGDIVVAQLQDPSTDVFNLETAAGPGAGGEGQFSYDDDLGNVIDLLDNLPPLPFTTLAFSTFEQEEFDGEDGPGTFIPEFFTPFASGVAGGFEDWQPNQHVADFTEFPMQLVINYTPPAGDNDVVDAINIADIPTGVRVFIGTPGVPGSFTELTVTGGEVDITSATLGTQSIFMLPQANSDNDFTVTVNLETRDPDTNEIAILTEPATAIIDAVADKPEVDGTVELADGSISATAVSGADGQNVKFNVDIDFFDNDGSELHTIVVTGVPQQWSLLSDDGLSATPANQPDGTVTYTVTVGAGFDGTLEFNPGVWNSSDFGGPATVTFTAAAEEVEFDQELLLTNNLAVDEQTFQVTLSDDVPEVILVSGPAVLDEDDLTIPGSDTVDGTITVDFFSDAPGSIALTTDGLDALGLTSQGDALTYQVSPDGLVVTAFDASNDPVFTVTLDPTPVTNGTEETYTYTFELLQPLDHDAPGGAADSLIDIPVQFVATDSDGDTANGQIDLQVIDDTPIVQDQTETVDETTDLGTALNGTIPTDFGADGGEIKPTNTITTSVSLFSDGQPVSIAFDGANTYTATKPGGNVVFTATINPDGSYEFVQELPLDHPDTNDSNDAIDVSFRFIATDGDNDTAAGDLKITILDDGPATESIETVILDETDGLSQTTSGIVPHAFGEDGAGSVEPSDNFNATGSVAGPNLTSGGEEVTVTLVGDTYTGETAGGNVIFTMTINDDGSYDFEIFEPLDHADGSNPDDVINLNFEYQVVDNDGDTVTGEVTVPIRDDAPVAVDDTALIPEGSNTANGNVIDNDEVGEDVEGSLTQVEAPDGTIVTFAADGQTDADGTFIEVDGDYGTLKIYEDGDYTYTSNGTATNSVNTFMADPGDVAGSPSSIVEDGITISTTDGTLTYVDLGDGAGLGIDGPGNDSQKVVNETLNVKPNDPVDVITFTVADIGSNNAGDGIDVKVFFSNDPSDFEWVEFQLPNPHPVDGLATFVVDIDDFPGKDSIDSIDITSMTSQGTLDRSSFTLNKVIVETKEIVKDEFEYTLRDYDGDTDTAVLEVCIENGKPFVPVNVNNQVDETFIEQTVSEVIIVDGATSFALGTVDGNLEYNSGGSQLNGNLTSNGVAVAVALVGGQIVGTAGGEDIFTLDLNNDGTYTFTLLGTLDHADGNYANDVINLNFTYTAENQFGQAVEGNISIDVLDDIPVPCPDHNVFTGNSTDGNVLTGAGSVDPSVAGDSYGEDGPGGITQVEAPNGTIVTFADDAQVDAKGVFIEVTGDNGLLKLYENGDYTYTLENKSLECAELHLGDVHLTSGQDTITDNGIAVSVVIGDNLSFWDGGVTHGSGVGINSTLHSTPKVYNGEKLSVKFDKPSELVELTVGDIGQNNAGDGIDIKVFYNETEYVAIEVQMPSTIPSDGLYSFSIDAAELGLESIYEVHMFNGYGYGNLPDTSFVLNDVKSYCACPSSDEFVYTIEDYDGDARSTTLTVEATDPDTSASTIYGSTTGSGNVLLESDVLGDVFYNEAANSLDVSELLVSSSYEPGVSDVADYLQIDSGTGDVHLDITGTGNFSGSNVIATVESGSTFDTINVVLNDDEGDIPVQIV